MMSVEIIAGIRIDPSRLPRKPISGLKKSWASGWDAMYSPRNSVPASGSIWNWNDKNIEMKLIAKNDEIEINDKT